MSPILPLQLKSLKPKHSRYPTAILTVGDELRSVRLDRGFTQHQVAEIIGVNRNFVYEMELGHHSNTIYALHKVYLFLGYIPTMLKIDKTALQGKFKAYRICTGKTFSLIANEIELDKSTLSRFEKELSIKKETYSKIENYIKHC